jgi:hypothetical protein
MCIAIVKESGVPFPTKEVLERCWENNDDGGGYAVLLASHKWECKKGFMTFESFYNSFLSEDYQLDDTVLIHFRIGTSGKKTDNKEAHPDCTHPFPISNDPDDFMLHHFTAEGVVMHNGMCGSGDGDLSDTMVGIRDFVAPLSPYFDDKNIIPILHNLINVHSRWFIAKGNHTWYLGDWIEEEETGLWYSNKGYLPKPVHTNVIYYGAGVQTEDKFYSRNVPVHNIDAGKKEYFKDGKWCWDIWNGKDEKQDVTVIDDNIVFEVYDDNDVLMHKIDIHGNIIDDNTDDTELYDFDCPYCANSINESILNDRMECPFCNFNVYLPTIYNLPDDYECPNCGEQYYLIEPHNHVGDTECQKCGAIFSDKTGAILGWADDKDNKIYG